jgi:osmotically-inducible protein OsmY
MKPTTIKPTGRGILRGMMIPAILVVLLAGATPLSAQEKTDQAIADAVEDEFLFGRAIPSNQIDVTVADGIVTLDGKVGSLLAKRRAVRMAETVKGVRSIVNQIRVQPATARTDAAVRVDIESSLMTDPATESYEVDVSVLNGVATLTGTVDSWTEKQLAEKVAQGVKGVINNIDVVYEDDRADSEIANDIRQALRWDALVDHALIDVQVNDGAVTLSGTVGSAAEKRRALYDSWVTGVTSVEAETLNVERWARDEDLRKDKYADVSDDEIRDAINDALLYDPRVMSFTITPDVAGSTVTLRGVVDNLKAKRAAEQVARNTVGVTYVQNRLKVRPLPEVEDSEVAEDVRDALLLDPYVQKYQIDVTVANGVVTLRGTVDSYFEKLQADDVASMVLGVSEVKNNLDVEYEGPLAYEPYLDGVYVYDFDWYDYEPSYTFVPDSEIRDEIQSQLWWSPFVDEDDVTVLVEDGVATLTGTVDSWSERESATQNAYEGGAVWVDNELSVD